MTNEQELQERIHELEKTLRDVFAITNFIQQNVDTMYLAGYELTKNSDVERYEIYDLNNVQILAPYSLLGAVAEIMKRTGTHDNP